MRHEEAAPAPPCEIGPDWSNRSLADHNRPLNRRGKWTRKVIARHVAGWSVDLVLCSTAVRARASAKPVIDALGCAVHHERALSTACRRELLELVRALPASACSG